MEKLSQPKEFKIQKSYGIGGGETPTYKEIEEEDAISMEQANEIVEHFLENTKLDFQCIYNGCENRAMVMSLMLRDKNIAHRKIWNFDPAKIALYNKPNQLNLKDPLGLIKEVSWDYHVAIIVLIKNKAESKTEKYVIDPGFTHSPLKVFDWLAQSNSSDSYFTYLDPEWYDLVGLETNSTIACNPDSKIILPECFPEIYTGDFYEYSSENISTIADELAADKQITDFTHKVIDNMKEGSEKDQLSAFLSDYKKVDPVLKGDEEVNKSHPFHKYVEEYRKAYQELNEHWLEKLKELQPY